MRWALASGIVVLVAFELAVAAREGWLTWRTLLPLELCDAAMVLAVITLVAPRRPAAELVYFWAGSGTLLAMLTPELPWNSMAPTSKYVRPGVGAQVTEDFPADETLFIR